MASVQTQYEINPDVGFAGGVALPEMPHAVTAGRALVDTTYTTKPKPGDAMVYVRASNAWVTARDSDKHLVRGVLSYRPDTVQDRNDDIEYENGDEIQVAILGGYWVNVNVAVSYDDPLVWDADERRFVRQTVDTASVADIANTAGGNTPSSAQVDTAIRELRTNINNVLAAVGRTPITCATRQPVPADGIAIARIAYGRNF